MLDARALIQKYRARGALIDTNLLVLFLIGVVNKRRIPEFKRTQSFAIEDFDHLNRLVKWFGKLIATPHVLSEVSNLSDLPGNELGKVRQLLRTIVEQLDEQYDPSRVLVQDPLFAHMGLTDASIAAVCSKGILVVTADVELQLALQRRGFDALNFNHVRTLAWRSSRSFP